MLKQITSAQLTELEAFWGLEAGWGEYKEDYRHAGIMAMHANLNRDSKKRPQPYKPDDFVMRPINVKRIKEDNTKKIMATLDMLSVVGEGKKHG